MTNPTPGKIFTGQVVSDKALNTIVVLLSYTYRHPKYHKIINKHQKIYSQNNLSAKIGDIVRVRECRPLSRLKRFTTIEIIKNKS